MSNEIVFDVYKNTLKCAGGLSPVSGEFSYSEIVCRFDENDEDWNGIAAVTFGFFVTAKKTVGAVATKANNEARAALPSTLIKGYSEVYVGIVGTSGGKTIATNVVKIDVKRGIVTDNMEGVEETESLYQEIISAFNDGLSLKADKTSVYTRAETNTALAAKADAAATAEALAAKANTADVMKYVYVKTGSVDDCTQPNTVYNVWIDSGIVTSDRALVFCEQTHEKSKLVQYALTRSDFIIFRNWSNDTWDAWDYIPTHSKMDSEIRLAVIRKAIGIEADKTLDVHNASIALYMSTADYSASDYTTTNLPNSLSTSADKPNTTSVSIPNGGVSIKIQDTQSNAEWSESVSGSSHVIQNLIPNRTYLYNVLNAAGSVLASGVCKTTGQVRMINGKGNTFNIRDIGGWKCFDGSSECGKIKYGKIYRGARLNGATGGKPAVSLNNNQVAYFKDVLGIRDEIDLRGNTDTAQINDTALGIGVDYVRINIAYYQYSLHDAQNPENTSRYASIIKRIAKDIKENKPIYLHCASGADRTAQVCALVEAICGVRQTDIDRDYELTWFSCETDGSRLDTRRRNYTSSDGGGDWNKFINGSHITGVEDINGITEMEGSSFNDKVVRYLLRAGVTIDEINTIRFGLIEGSPAKLVSPYGSVTISKTLNHINIDNPLTAVEKYQPYVAKITVDNFYKVSQFSITMGGVDCTTQCYQSGKIYIPRVTGNIVISGSAIEPSTVEDFGITDVYTHREADKAIADTIDATIIEDIIIDNIVDQQYNPEGHLMKYYIDSDNVRHNLFDFSNLPSGGTSDYSEAAVEQMIANVRSKNLLDVSATEQDVSLNYTNGDTLQAANRNTTDYIAVTPGMYLVSSYYVRRVQQPYSLLAICFYDSDKTFLSGSQSRFAAAVPEGAAFARVTGNTYFINPDFDVQLEMRETPYPTFYEPHRADAQGLNDQVIKANRIVTRDNRNGNFYHALPSKVFIKSGESLTVYFKNVLSHPKYMLSFFIADRVNNTESVSVTVFNYDDRAVFTASGSGTVKIPFSIHDDNFDLVDYGTLEAKVVSNDAPSASVLLIGDSTVEQGNEVSKALKNLYSGASGTLTLLGTRGTSPYNHEGRSGWKAQEYASVASKSDVLNAFWDGEAFNFSYYMSQQGYSSADAVVLQLGINDLISKSVEKLNASEIIGYIDAMVQSVRAFSATARVMINLVTPPNSDGASFTEKYHGTQAEWLYRYNTVKFNHLLREFYRGDNSVTVLGVNLPLETYTDIFDGVHPRTSGYQKIAKTVYDCLAAQL